MPRKAGPTRFQPTRSSFYDESRLDELYQLFGAPLTVFITFVQTIVLPVDPEHANLRSKNAVRKP